MDGCGGQLDFLSLMILDRILGRFNDKVCALCMWTRAPEYAMRMAMLHISSTC